MSFKNENEVFKHQKPTEKLEEFIECYWQHHNNTNEAKTVTIFPDSFFKVIFAYQQGKLVSYFLTGLWTQEMPYTIPPNTLIVGVKFKILASEYIFKTELGELINSQYNLPPDFWNIRDYDFSGFHSLTQHIEDFLLNDEENLKPIQAKKLQLSQLLYMVKGNITADEVSNQINWSNSQINRYLNKYIGVPLKTYLNIQKCYNSYFEIRDGQFYPTNEYYDQAHFIREIKKHTNQTPSELFKKRNARFIQLKLINR